MPAAQNLSPQKMGQIFTAISELAQKYAPEACNRNIWFENTMEALLELSNELPAITAKIEAAELGAELIDEHHKTKVRNLLRTSNHISYHVNDYINPQRASDPSAPSLAGGFASTLSQIAQSFAQFSAMIERLNSAKNFKLRDLMVAGFVRSFQDSAIGCLDQRVGGALRFTQKALERGDNLVITEAELVEQFEYEADTAGETLAGALRSLQDYCGLPIDDGQEIYPFSEVKVAALFAAHEESAVTRLEAWQQLLSKMDFECKPNGRGTFYRIFFATEEAANLAWFALRCYFAGLPLSFKEREKMVGVEAGIFHAANQVSHWDGNEKPYFFILNQEQTCHLISLKTGINPDLRQIAEQEDAAFAAEHQKLQEEIRAKREAAEAEAAQANQKKLNQIQAVLCARGLKLATLSLENDQVLIAGVSAEQLSEQLTKFSADFSTADDLTAHQDGRLILNLALNALYRDLVEEPQFLLDDWSQVQNTREGLSNLQPVLEHKQLKFTPAGNSLAPQSNRQAEAALVKYLKQDYLKKFGRKGREIGGYLAAWRIFGFHWLNDYAQVSRKLQLREANKGASARILREHCYLKK